MRLSFLTTAFLIGALTPAGAQQAVQPPSQTAGSVLNPQGVPRVVLPPRVGVEGQPSVTMTLDEAVRLALEQNNDVEIARLGVDVAAEDLQAARGAFDPFLSSALSYQKATIPQTSAIGGAASGTLSQDDLTGTVQLSQRSPWLGSQLSFDFTGSRLGTTNQFARLNPQFPAALGATLVQPLFRNLRIDAQRRQVLLARRAQDLTDAQLRQVIIEQLTLIEQAYWELVYGADNVAVQAEALAQARAQVSSNERQSQQGTLAPIDVVEAQTQISTFEQALASAQQALTEAENRLKALILSDRNSPVWDQAVVAAETTGQRVPMATVDDAMAQALAHRPELARLSALEAQNEVDRQFFHDQTLPRVDVVGSYSLAGLAGRRLQTTSNPLANAADIALYARLNDLSDRAGLLALDAPVGTGNTPLPEFLQGDLSNSLNNLFARRFPTALVQIQLDLPLRNRTAEANAARSDIQRRDLGRQRQQLEQAVESEVRSALQRIRSAEQRLTSAASAARGANEQYESERRRFDSGLSTVFLVLQRQSAFVTARGQELRARADLNQAVSLFDRAVGATLDHHGVLMKE